MASDVLTETDQDAVPIRLPDRFEVVNGEIVEVPPVSLYADEVSNRLKEAMDRYLAAHDVGRARIEVMFRIPLPEDQTRNRRPDVAFFSYERWARNRPLPLTGHAIDVVPELAVEVVSPTDYAEDVQSKAREYIRGGVRVVWQIFPKTRQLLSFEGPQSARVYTANDEVDGGPILPGFRFRLADLLPEVAPDEAS
jgi:Uma2 family endonuclease